jgi:hypothetical protein
MTTEVAVGLTDDEAESGAQRRPLQEMGR